MTYNELLSQEQWQEKCIEILHRDRYRCQKCGALGYHNNAYYECDTADELDDFLKGILIEDDMPSEFVDKNRKSTGLCDFFIFRNKDCETSNNQSLGGNVLLYDLRVTRNIRIPQLYVILPTASKCIIQEKKCKGFYLPIDRYNVKISPEINLQYNTGCYFHFDKSYFDKYIVRIEKRLSSKTDGVELVTIISICYQNCCISLEFGDKDENKNSIVLNVHHKYYVGGKAPWEYDCDALITLCQDCHYLEHKSTQTPVYKNIYKKQVMAYAEVCDRCGGSGYLPQFHHRDNGICYQCHGEGVIVDPNDVIADI